MYALYLGNDFCKQVSCGNLFFKQKETIFKRGSLFSSSNRSANEDLQTYDTRF